MSFWYYTFDGVQDVSGDVGGIGVCYADKEADIGTRTAFTGKVLLGGSTCHAIAEGSDWMLDSAGVWHKQPDPHTTQLDLSGYYTKAEVDAAIAAAEAAASIASLSRGESIPAGANLDTYTTAGRYYCTSGNSASVTNKPYAVSVSFQLTVEQNQGSARPLQTLTYNTNSATYINKVFRRWFDPVTLQYGAWHVWDGVQV